MFVCIMRTRVDSFHGKAAVTMVAALVFFQQHTHTTLLSLIIMQRREQTRKKTACGAAGKGGLWYETRERGARLAIVFNSILMVSAQRFLLYTETFASYLSTHLSSLGCCYESKCATPGPSFRSAQKVKKKTLPCLNSKNFVCIL